MTSQNKTKQYFLLSVLLKEMLQRLPCETWGRFFPPCGWSWLLCLRLFGHVYLCASREEESKFEQGYDLWGGGNGLLLNANY